MSQFPRAGRVAWIGLRPAPDETMRVVPTVEAIAGRGLAGDRTAERARRGNARQVTFIQAEHLSVIGALLGRAVDPSLTRRNIVVAGVNLLALKGHAFSIGSARFEMTGDCHPCTAMEAALGPGGYNAMRGMGGITAIVLDSGTVSVGDALRVEAWPAEVPRGDAA
ncbi:MAG: MOSC domain-containing protein [Betaproteobacteria bacterium]|nr:MOSC domain-containing protein [Betaproteobacteria bacterium]